MTPKAKLKNVFDCSKKILKEYVCSCKDDDVILEKNQLKIKHSDGTESYLHEGTADQLRSFIFGVHAVRNRVEDEKTKIFWNNLTRNIK